MSDRPKLNPRQWWLLQTIIARLDCNEGTDIVEVEIDGPEMFKDLRFLALRTSRDGRARVGIETRSDSEVRMKFLALIALVAFFLVGGATPLTAHLHVEGVILGQPFAWDDSGILQGITSVPSPWKGYTITSFDFVGRQPDDQIHTDEFTYSVTWK